MALAAISWNQINTPIKQQALTFNGERLPKAQIDCANCSYPISGLISKSGIGDFIVRNCILKIQSPDS